MEFRVSEKIIPMNFAIINLNVGVRCCILSHQNPHSRAQIYALSHKISHIHTRIQYPKQTKKEKRERDNIVSISSSTTYSCRAQLIWSKIYVLCIMYAKVTWMAICKVVVILCFAVLLLWCLFFFFQSQYYCDHTVIL